MLFRKSILLVIITIWLQNQFVFSQEPKVTEFSLKNAVEYSLKNSPVLKNSKLDVETARKQVKEIFAIGLPQITGSGNFNYNAQIPVQVLPNFINQGLPPGSPKGPEFIQAQFGIPYTLIGSISVDQLLFDGTYFLGLKAASQFVDLSDHISKVSEVEIRVNVTKAYYVVLITKENIDLVAQNIKTIEKTFNETKALYENGFVEKLDVDRLKLSVSNLKIQKSKLEDQLEISKRLLKFQMGMDVNAEITLTDNLETLNSEMISSETFEKKPDYFNRPEYKVVNQQLALSKMNQKRYQAGYFPTLKGSLSHQQATFAQKGEFGDLGNTWYPGTILGLHLNVPIFDGLRKSALIQQTKIDQAKILNTKASLENSIELEIFSSRTKYKRAIEQLELQKSNKELAGDIYRTTQIKLQEGVGSTLELTTAESELKAAQTNYLSAIFDLLLARLELEKSLGLKK